MNKGVCGLSEPHRAKGVQSGPGFAPAEGGRRASSSPGRPGRPAPPGACARASAPRLARPGDPTAYPHARSRPVPWAGTRGPRPTRRLPETRLPPVGGAVGPRRREDPQRQNKGMRGGGGEARRPRRSPVSLPPRGASRSQAEVPARHPSAAPSPADRNLGFPKTPRVRRRGAARGRSRSGGGATRPPAGRDSLPPELAQELGADARGPRATLASREATAITWG